MQGLKVSNPEPESFYGSFGIVSQDSRMPRSRALKAVQGLAVMLGAGLVGFALVTGSAWLLYVSVGTAPDDRIGVRLNRYAPPPLRAWGCARIAERFPKSPPPEGCART